MSFFLIMGCSLPKLPLSILDENLLNMLVFYDAKLNPGSPKGKVYMEHGDFVRGLNQGIIGLGPNGKAYFLGHEVIEYDRVLADG